MKQELDDALVRDFPNLYADRKSDQSPFYWGFECGDGWEPLLRKLSAEIEAIIVSMPEKERKKYRVKQVKEKFGTLRFYMGIAHDGIRAAIDRAEQESAVTCECCGKPGSSGSVGGWLSVLCDEHRAERQKKKR
ncbi:MAG: hypothetical protein DKT66_02790 [Candidatus Melainabacteria bacterium]|nr:MAG: hypothetical protein DKT66_02790 [Candidatus Melainabacteria bacterium]